jgi:hypothetical protein
MVKLNRTNLDSLYSRLYGGTGLGLVISAKLASAMGGMMWVESSGIPGQGSTFLFRAKFGTAETSSSSSPIHVYSFKEAKALVVDDNDTSCRMLAGLLEVVLSLSHTLTHMLLFFSFYWPHNRLFLRFSHVLFEALIQVPDLQISRLFRNI